jgi:hypothetical protein
MALSDNQKEQIRNINAIQMSVGLLGSIGGLIYAKKTGGGFWRYVGYWIAGGLVTGIPAMLVATPFKNKILKDGDKVSKPPVKPAEGGLGFKNEMNPKGTGGKTSSTPLPTPTGGGLGFSNKI